MGKHAYLLLVHNNMWQVNNLLKLLDDERVEIFVHIDARSSMQISDIDVTGLSSVCHVYKEIKVYWSDFSLVEAELFLLEKAKEYGCFDYYHLLSGADLPLRSQKDILRFYDENAGKEFIECQLPGEFLPEPYYERIKYYHIFTRHLRKHGRYGKLISFFAVAAEYSFIFVQWLFRVDRIRKIDVFAKGSQWFDITDDLATYVLSKKDWIAKQFRMTRASDEFFLQILVLNSEFKNRLYRKDMDDDMHSNMRFIDWKRGEPYLFRVGDFEELISSDLMFARKFDERVDASIIEKISLHVKGIR